MGNSIPPRFKILHFPDFVDFLDFRNYFVFLDFQDLGFLFGFGLLFCLVSQKGTYHSFLLPGKSTCKFDINKHVFGLTEVIQIEFSLN